LGTVLIGLPSIAAANSLATIRPGCDGDGQRRRGI